MKDTKKQNKSQEEMIMKQTYLTLNDANKIPQFGLGVYMIRGDEETKTACLDALKWAIATSTPPMRTRMSAASERRSRESGIPREEIWITSKLWPSEYGEGKTMAGIDKCWRVSVQIISTCCSSISSLAIISGRMA